MSLSTALAEGRDHDVWIRTHTRQALAHEEDARTAGGTDLPRDIHAARLEWAMAVCALLAWARYGGES